jgi:hypothetical protein
MLIATHNRGDLDKSNDDPDILNISDLFIKDDSKCVAEEYSAYAVKSKGTVSAGMEKDKDDINRCPKLSSPSKDKPKHYRLKKRLDPNLKVAKSLD